MKNTVKRSIISLVAILMTCCLSITAFAATIPKANGQNKNNWCWATAAKMVAEKNGGAALSSTAQVLTNTGGLHSYGGVAYYGVNDSGKYTANGAQRSIVVHIKGNDNDAGGNDTNKQDALQYASSNTMSVGTFGNYGTPLSSTQINNIKTDLNGGKYVIGNMVAGGAGHSVAIYSYRSSDDKYRIVDPWDTTDYYYSSNSIFSTAGFPIFGSYGRIDWIQYCR
ncbi:MAG: hypothetical protein ACK5L0_01640 [Candidatus Fimivivens sp.]